MPLASTINFQAERTIASGVLVAICADAVLACSVRPHGQRMGPAAADIVIDVFGFTAP